MNVVDIFVILVFIHFVVDWIFQTHYEAMNKGINAWVRALHCTIYAAGFLPILLYFNSLKWVATALYVLWVSHFFEDTYKPVIWWFRNIRRHPAFNSGDFDFKKFLAESPLHYILLIAIDQIIHISFLWIVAVIIYSNM